MCKSILCWYWYLLLAPLKPCCAGSTLNYIFAQCTGKSLKCFPKAFFFKKKCFHSFGDVKGFRNGEMPFTCSGKTTLASIVDLACFWKQQ